MYIDYIFLNEDRHLANIVLIYNSVTKIFKPSLIFDNGCYLLSDITQDYPLGKNLDSLIRNVKAKSFSTDFKNRWMLVKLYPSNLKLEFDLDLCRSVLNNSPYSDEINTRVLSVLTRRKSIIEKSKNSLYKTSNFI